MQGGQTARGAVSRPISFGCTARVTCMPSWRAGGAFGSQTVATRGGLLQIHSHNRCPRPKHRGDTSWGSVFFWPGAPPARLARSHAVCRCCRRGLAAAAARCALLLTRTAAAHAINPNLPLTRPPLKIPCRFCVLCLINTGCFSGALWTAFAQTFFATSTRL